MADFLCGTKISLLCFHPSTNSTCSQDGRALRPGLCPAHVPNEEISLAPKPTQTLHTYVKAHISCTTTTMNSILLSLMVTLETETDLSCTQGELFLCISMESFYDPAFLPTKMARLIIHVESTTLLNWDTANQLERWVTEVSRRQHPKKGWCVVWVWGSRVLGAPPGAWDKWWQETALGFLPDLTNWTPGKGVREQLQRTTIDINFSRQVLFRDWIL